MRMAIVRTDLPQGIYLQDVENTSQRNFSSQPVGQSRYFSRPSDAALTAALASTAFVTIQGSDQNATVDTTIANGTLLNIRDSASRAYVQVAVTSDAALSKAQIVAELNVAFQNAGLALTARIAGTNQITIDTTAGGPGAYVSVSATVPSTGALHTVLGITAATTVGATLAQVRGDVYPTSETVDVSSSTVVGITGGTFALMTAAQQAALVNAVADVIAPQLVETGPVIRSFVYGAISKLTAATFQPGGARGGLVAGLAAAVVEDDGSTPYTV